MNRRARQNPPNAPVSQQRKAQLQNTVRELRIAQEALGHGTVTDLRRAIRLHFDNHPELHADLRYNRFFPHLRRGRAAGQDDDEPQARAQPDNGNGGNGLDGPPGGGQPPPRGDDPPRDDDEAQQDDPRQHNDDPDPRRNTSEAPSAARQGILRDRRSGSALSALSKYKPSQLKD